jgi:putative transposase
MLVKKLARWEVRYGIEIPDAPSIGMNFHRPVGVDVGLETFAALSDGVMIANPRPYRRAEQKLKAKQRQIAKARKGSKRRGRLRLDLARASRRVQNIRRTFHHQQSAWIVKEYDFIGVENLNVKGLARGMLSKAVHDAGWSQYLRFIEYKVACTGTIFVAVNPRNTSKECPVCDTLVPKTLAERTHNCPNCGYSVNRDTAGAQKVKERALENYTRSHLAVVGQNALPVVNQNLLRRKRVLESQG